VISRLTAEWQADYDAWQKRDLSRGDACTCGRMGSTCRPEWKKTPNACWWLIGATPEGKKELVGFQTGVREGAQSWRELLIDIKQRGLEIAPDLAVGDGALGFWKAIEEVFPSTRHQRCWVHKTEPTPCSLVPCDLVELCTTAAQRERYRSCRHCQPSSRS
jgi:putative transposase